MRGTIKLYGLTKFHIYKKIQTTLFQNGCINKTKTLTIQNYKYQNTE